MAYSHKTQFPRSSIQIANISNGAASAIFAASSGKFAISHIVISNAHAATTRTVIFRGASAGTEILRVILLTGTTIVIPGWLVGTAGLEVIDAGSAVAGVYATVFYATHGQS